MKFLTTFMAAMLMMSGPAFAEVTVGEPAPDFTLTDTNGTSHSLSDFAGKNVVLEWTNHDCPFVVKHYHTGNMQKIQANATENDVIWLTINSSAEGKQGHTTAEMANELMAEKETKQTARLLDHDGTVGKLYGAKVTPHMFVIDSDGVLAYQGAIDDTPSALPSDVETANNYIVAALDALAKGERPDPSNTKPYGCSVKY